MGTGEPVPTGDRLVLRQKNLPNDQVNQRQRCQERQSVDAGYDQCKDHRPEQDDDPED